MNLLENDTTEFIKQSVIETREQISTLRAEIESCQDYLAEAADELARRNS